MNKRSFSLVLISLIAIVVLVGIIVIIKSTSITGDAIISKNSRRTIPGTSPSPIPTNHRHVTDPFTVISSAVKTGGQQVTPNTYAPSKWDQIVDCTKESNIQKLTFPSGTKFIVLEAGYYLESVSQTPDLSGVVVYQDHTFPSSPTYPYSDVYYFKASDPQNKLKSATVYVTCAAIEPTYHLFSNKDY